MTGSSHRATGELSRRAFRGGPAALFRVAVTLLLTTASLAAGATPMQQAIDAATADLLAGLFERPPGVVRWIQGPDEVVATFDGPVAERGSELVVQRRAGGSPFPRTVALLRVVDVRDSMARCVTLWRDGELKTGDEVTLPQPVTMFLDVPEDPSAPGQSRQLREAADRLELKLLDDPRVRVVRVERGAVPTGEAAIDRFAHTREYATVLTPQFIAGDERAEVVFTQRSVFTRETLLSARATLPAGVGLAASGLPGRGVAGAGVGAAPPAGSAYGPATAPAGPEGLNSALRASGLGGRQIVVPEQLETIALGDVDGDGRLELVGTTTRQLFVYRWDGQRLQIIAEGKPLPRLTTYVSVDVGDVNQNRRDEIVVSYVSTFEGGGAPRSKVASRIYELRGDVLSEVVPVLDGRYARVLERSDAPPVLLTQQMGDSEPFYGPVDVHAWAGGRYQRTAQSMLPKGVRSLYGLVWSDLDGDRRAEIALIDEEDRLQIASADGQPLWRADLGPVASALGFPQVPPAHKQEQGAWGFNTPESYKAAWRQMPRRVVAAKRHDGAQLVTLSNGAATGFRYSAGGPYEGGRGQALGFGWDPRSGKVGKLWETAPLDAPARDLAVGDLSGDGRTELVVLSGAGDTRALTVVPLWAGAS